MATDNSALKIISLFLGLFVCYLFLNPPAVLLSLGLVRFLVPVAILVVGVISLTILSLRANLPENAVLTPDLNAMVPEEMKKLAHEFKKLGFTPASDYPLIIRLTTPSTLLPFVHPQEKTHGTVFKTGSVPARISFELLSFFETTRGGLSTSTVPEGGVLPAPSGSFKQIFPKGGVASLFEKHRQALAYLKQKGFECRDVSCSTFERDFKASMARLREHVVASPVSSAVIAVWRTITKRSPYFGAIQTQALAQRQLRRLNRSRH